MSSAEPLIVTYNDYEFPPLFKILLYGMPLISYISFLLTFIFAIIIKFNAKKSFILVKSVSHLIFFVSAFIGVFYNLAIYNKIKVHNNDITKKYKYNNKIFKINSIILGITIGVSILYLLSSIALGCL